MSATVLVLWVGRMITFCIIVPVHHAMLAVLHHASVLRCWWVVGSRFLADWGLFDSSGVPSLRSLLLSLSLDFFPLHVSEPRLDFSEGHTFGFRAVAG